MHIRPRHATALALVLSSGALFAAANPSDSIFGALRVSSLNELASSTADFAERVSPGSGAAASQLTAGAEQLGIALDQELLALVLDPAVAPMPFAFVLPAVDPATLRAHPAFAFEATPRADVYRVALPNGERYYASFLGNRLVLSPLEPGLEAALAALRSGEDLRGLRAAGGQIGLSLSASRLYSAYKPLLDLMLGAFVAQLESGAAPAPGQPDPRPAAAIFTGLVGRLADLEEFRLRLSLQASGIELGSSLVARPGSTLATLLSPGHGPEAPSLGALDPTGAITVGAVSLRPDQNWWQAYTRTSLDLLASLGAPESAAAATARASMEKTFSDFADAWDGSAAFTLLGTESSISSTGSAGLADADRALALLRDFPEMQKNTAELNTAQGFSSTLVLGEEQTYQGARLIEVTQTHTATSPAGEEALAMMEKLGMAQMHATYAITPRRAFYALGAEATPRVKKLIDSADQNGAGTDLADLGLPADSNLFLAISLPRYLRWFSGAGVLPFSIPEQAASTRPGMLISAKIDQGRADALLRVSAAEIAILIESFSAAAAAPAPDAESLPELPAPGL
jgi:hypothetical protein